MYLHYATELKWERFCRGWWLGSGVFELEVDGQFAAIGQAIFVCGCPDAPVTTES